MKILFAIKSLNVAGGGAERVFVDVANGLAALGHAVKALTFDRPGESFYRLDHRIDRIDIGIGEPGQPTPRTAVLTGLQRIRRASLQFAPDVVVAFMHSTYVPVWMALAGTGLRLVVSEHVDAAHFRSRPLQRLLAELASRAAVAKTVPSAAAVAEQAHAVQAKVHVLPNPVDVAAFASGAKKPPAQPPVVLSVGRFMEEKNQSELIRAFAAVVPRHPEWTLRIVGDGVLRPQLEALVHQLGLGSRVQLPGVSRSIGDEYQRASLVVVPSLYESFGMVAAEALASSRPVLALDCCLGISELVDDGVNGLLVSGTGDRVANLAAGMECLFSDPGLCSRLGAAGPASVGRYSLQQVVQRWTELLTSFERRSTAGPSIAAS